MRMQSIHLVISLDVIPWRAFTDGTCPSMSFRLHMLIKGSCFREGYRAMRAQIRRIFSHRIRAAAKRVGRVFRIA